MALTPEQIDDFVNLTLKLYRRDRWVDISLEHQEYVALSTMVTEKKLIERGGSEISWRVQVKNTGNAKNTGLFAESSTKVEDVTVEAKIPWTMQQTSFAYDVYEPEFQSDRETIIDLIKVRVHDAMNSMAELMEQNLWSAPTGTSDKRPYGIPFWVQKDASTTPDGAFNGGNPTGFSDGAAGINSTTYPRWKNWTFGYTNVVRGDLVTKMRKASEYTRFMAPNAFPELSSGKLTWAYYTVYDVLRELEQFLEDRNDNLGADIAKYAGQTLFRSNPVFWVPYLQSNDGTNDPVYGINWSVFRPVVKRGCDMKRNPPLRKANQQSVREVYIDHWSQYQCLDRRKLFVGSIA